MKNKKKLPHPPTGPTPSTLSPLSLIGLLFLSNLAVVFIVFHQGLRIGFVGDDWFYLRQTRLTPILKLLNPFYLDNYFTHYRPLATLFFKAIYPIAGFNSAWYHVGSLFGLAFNGMLVGLLSWIFWRSLPLSILTGSFFVSTLSQWYPANFPNIISDVQLIGFLLLMVITYLRGRYIMSTFCYALACASKETAIIGWPLLLFYESWRHFRSKDPLKKLPLILLKKQAGLALLNILLIARTTVFAPHSSKVTAITPESLQFDFIQTNSLLGLQWLIPYHSFQSPLHYGITPIPWAYGLGALIAIIAFTTTIKHSPARGWFLLGWFFVGFLPWGVMPTFRVMPHYIGFSSVAFFLAFGFALFKITRRHWPALLLSVLIGFQTLRSIPLLERYGFIQERSVLAQEIVETAKQMVPSPRPGHVFIFAGFTNSIYSTNAILLQEGLRAFFGDPTLVSLDFTFDQISRPAPGTIFTKAQYVNASFRLTPADPVTVLFQEQPHQWKDVTSSFFATGEPVLSWLRTATDQFKQQSRMGEAAFFQDHIQRLSPTQR